MSRDVLVCIEKTGVELGISCAQFLGQGDSDQNNLLQ
jgi:hypothetical protein